MLKESNSTSARTEQFLSVRQAAERLQVSVWLIRDYLQKGKLKGAKLGSRLWRIPESALSEFMTERQAAA